MELKRYGAIDGLRTIAAIGIVMMHIRVNNDYTISNFVYDTVIASFTNFVFLFMTMSAFGMCCGYYEKILTNQISISDFYRKRAEKIWPFFAVLVLIDLIVSPSLHALYEGFADLTLLFGLLPAPTEISVIGVGWFLGLIFVFYLCFPFFCVLLETKKRAWIAFGISLIYNFVCTQYFEVRRSNILYSAMFFIAGGLIYLYRREISQLNRWIMLLAAGIAIGVHYVVGGNPITWLLVSMTLLIYALLSRGRVLVNRFTRFFSSISLEIYLSHMFIFRIIEKLCLNTIIGSGWLQYIVTVLLTLAGAVVFALVMQKLFAVGRGLAAQRAARMRSVPNN